MKRIFGVDVGRRVVSIFFAGLTTTSIVAAAAILFVAEATGNPAHGQIMRVEQRLWRSGTTLAVFNETNFPLVIFIDGSPRGVANSAESWSGRLGGGVWPFYANEYSRSLVLSIRVCEEITPVSFFAPYPSWATNRDLLGSLAITLEDAQLSEPALRKKVRLIERLLQEKKPLGWRLMRHEIHDWVRSIAEGSPRQKCVGPLLLAGEVSVYEYNYGWSGDRSRAVTFSVRESGAGIYSIERAGSSRYW